jgi:hypothetical protein
MLVYEGALLGVVVVSLQRGGFKAVDGVSGADGRVR